MEIYFFNYFMLQLLTNKVRVYYCSSYYYMYLSIIFSDAGDNCKENGYCQIVTINFLQVATDVILSFGNSSLFK